MSSISLEAFDTNIRGKYTQWILPSQEFCALPNGFQDQILSGTPAFQTSILLLTKQESRAWFLSFSWDMTFTPESPTDWSLILSILQHLKKPILLVTTPKCLAPSAFWLKCLSMNPTPTCIALRELSAETPTNIHPFPHTIFFPRLDFLTESQFMKIPSSLASGIQTSIQSLDLRSLYRDLRGAGASLCLSLTDSRFSTGASGLTINSQSPSYSAMWFYPENNGALRLHLSDLRMILRTITERLSDS